MTDDIRRRHWQEALSTQSLTDKWRRWEDTRRFSAWRSQFYEDAVDSGLQFREYAYLRADQLERRGDALHRPVARIAHQLALGMPVSSALSMAAPATDIALISAYERHGRLDEGLRTVARLTQEARKLASEARQAAIKPTLYLALAFALLTFGLPAFIDSIKGLLPVHQRTLDQSVLIALASFMANAGSTLLILAGVATGLCIASMPHWTGSARRWVDRRLPPYTLYRSYQAAIFMKTLAVQLSVTPRLEDALQSIGDHASPWLNGYLQEIVDELPAVRLSPMLAFDNGLLDQGMVDSLAIISQRGTAEQAIARRAEKATATALTSIRVQVTRLSMLATAVSGGLVLWIAFSFVLNLVRINTPITGPSASARP